MSFPEIETHISSPGELTTILRELKQCVAQGNLRHLKPNDTPLALDDFSAVPEEGPWPDYIEAYFEDPHGKRYKLIVETYHGTGGSWGPA